MENLTFYLDLLLSLLVLVSGVLSIMGVALEGTRLTKIGKILLALLVIVFIATITQKVTSHGIEVTKSAKADSTELAQLKASKARDREQLKQYENSTAKFNSILDRAETQIDLSQELNQKSEKIERLQYNLQLLSGKIASLNRELYNTVTGGNTFCYIRLIPAKDSKADGMLVKEGPYAIRNLELSVENPVLSYGSNYMSAPFEVDEQKLKDTEKNTTRFSKVDLPPSENVKYSLYKPIPFEWPRDSVLVATFVSSNGFWRQFITTRKHKDGIMLQSNKIYKTVYVNGKPIEKILLKFTQEIRYTMTPR